MSSSSWCASTPASQQDWASPSGLVILIVAAAHGHAGLRWSDLYRQQRGGPGAWRAEPHAQGPPEDALPLRRIDGLASVTHVVDLSREQAHGEMLELLAETA